MQGPREIFNRFLQDPVALVNDPKYINYIDPQYVSVPALVACYGRNDLVPLLAELNYDLNKCAHAVRPVGQDGYEKGLYGTPVEIAIDNGQFETALLLQQYGADVNATGRQSHLEPPLLRLTMNGDSHLEKIRFMLEKLRANVNVCDSNGRTPLLEATVWGYLNTCTLLLEYGADVNMQERYSNEEEPYNGRTPFLAAIMNDQAAIVDLFLQRGHVDMNRQRLNGKGPLDLAAASTLPQARLIYDKVMQKMQTLGW